MESFLLQVANACTSISYLECFAHGCCVALAVRKANDRASCGIRAGSKNKWPENNVWTKILHVILDVEAPEPNLIIVGKKLETLLFAICTQWSIPYRRTFSSRHEERLRLHNQSSLSLGLPCAFKVEGRAGVCCSNLDIECYNALWVNYSSSLSDCLEAHQRPRGTTLYLQTPCTLGTPAWSSIRPRLLHVKHSTLLVKQLSSRIFLLRTTQRTLSTTWMKSHISTRTAHRLSQGVVMKYASI